MKIYQSRHSQILIALWDGEYKNTIGGTSQVINFKLYGEPESYIKTEPSPLEPAERGPIYHILTPRKSNPSPKGEKYKLEIKYAEDFRSYEEKQKENDEILKNTDIFNNDIIKIFPKLLKSFVKSRGYLFSDEETKALPKDVKEMLNHFSQADVLSNYFENRRKKSLIILTILTLLSVLLFIYYKRTSNVVLLILFIYCVVFLFIYKQEWLSK